MELNYNSNSYYKATAAHLRVKPLNAIDNKKCANHNNRCINNNEWAQLQASCKFNSLLGRAELGGATSPNNKMRTHAKCACKI